MARICWPNGSTTSRPNLSAEGHFGPRNSTAPGASKYHRGQDMWGLGIIRAIADGTVVAVGWSAGYGWGGGYQVWIQHDGFFTRSLHMVDGSSPVKVGDRINAGDAIGVEGKTGAYEEHLHLEITPGQWHTANTGQVDPVAFITARLNPGSPAGAGTDEEDPMPIHEHKSRTKRQQLGKAGKFWPIEVSGGGSAAGEHRFASTGDSRETGTAVFTIVFSGGTPGAEVARVRTLHQEKVGGKWVTREQTEPIDVVATKGATAFQYVVQYAIGANYQSKILVQGLVDNVSISKVDYTKNYWRS